MHWFWRATGTVVLVAGGFFLLDAEIAPRGLGSSDAGMAIHFAALFAMTVLTIYGGLGRLFPHNTDDSELRCRKCQYILRGITEPRCPECGECI